MKTFLHTFLLTLGALTSMTSFVQAAAARPKAIPTVSLPMPAFTLSFDKIKGAAGAESLVGMTHVLKQEPMIAQLPSTLTQKSGSFTLSLWTKFNGIYGTQRLLDQDGQAPSRFALQLGGAHHRFAFAVLGADTQAESDFAPTPGQWYHISGVYDAPAKQIRLYADGTPLATAPVSAPLFLSGPIAVGRDMDGAIDEVCVYSRALSDAQIAALHRRDLARFQPDTFSWANPVYYAGSGPDDDIHDPAILNEGGVYYMVATLAPFRNYTDRDPKLPDLGSSPGIALYASRDLKVWKRKTWLLKSSELPDSSPYKHQFWAPELHKLGGRYYLIFGGSNWVDDKNNIGGRMGYYQFVGVADRLEGPYRHFVALKGPGVDTSMFEDDDGKTYVVWPGNEIHSVDLSQIDQDKITVGPMVSRAAGPEDYKALGKPVPGTMEGPYLIKHGGTYYCFFATTYSDLYATGIATAKNLTGPWTLDPRTRFFPGGHQSEFLGPDGGWWTAYKHEQSDTAPWLSLAPLRFGADGQVEITLQSGPQSILLPEKRKN